MCLFQSIHNLLSFIHSVFNLLHDRCHSLYPFLVNTLQHTCTKDEKKFPNKYLLNSSCAFFSLFTICCHLYIQYLIFLHNRCHSLYPLLVNTLLHNKKDVCQIMLCVSYLFQNRKSKHKSTSLAFFR